MKKNNKELLVSIGALLIAILIAYASWEIKRWINWEFQYKSGVEKIIQNKIKQECLNEN